MTRGVPEPRGSDLRNGLEDAVEAIPHDWLLEGEPFVAYRVFLDLMDLPETDERVQRVRRAVPRHRAIRAIFSRQNREGFWGSTSDIHTWWPRTDTTFWLLGILADFGLSSRNRRMAAACEYVFTTQHPLGPFGWGTPPTPAECFTGILVEALAKSGYIEDRRLASAYDWLLSRQRWDGGFWCKNTGQSGGRRQDEPSCAFASLCVLAALIQHPVHARGQAARKTVEFLLTCWERRREVKYAGHDSQIGTGWEKLKYPYTDYRILKYLDALSRFPHARSDPRAQEALRLLVAKGREDGRFFPESIHRAYSDFDFGQKQHPSRWLSVLAHGVLRRWSAERTTGNRPCTS